MGRTRGRVAAEDDTERMARISRTWWIGAGALAAAGLLWAVVPAHDPVHRTRGLAAVETPSPPDQTRLLYSTMTWQSFHHPTSGILEIYRVAGGDRLLRLADLATASGLEVGLSTDPYTAGTLLGGLRTHRASNYSIPAALDLTRVTSAVLWNPRLGVAVAAAPVHVTGVMG